MKNTFYVYVLQNPRRPFNKGTSDKYNLEYEPFYVGKGKGDRANVHYNNVLSNNSSHNSRLWAEINKIRSYGLEPVVTKIYFNSDEDKVYKKESEVITHYGLRYKDGLLVNSSFGKAGGWGGALNPTFDRMQQGTHNFQVNNPQVDTPKIQRLKKLILEVDKQESISTRKWLSRTGYSNIKALRIGIKRLILRDSLKYKLDGNTLKRI